MCTLLIAILARTWSQLWHLWCGLADSEIPATNSQQKSEAFWFGDVFLHQVSSGYVYCMWGIVLPSFIGVNG